MKSEFVDYVKWTIAPEMDKINKAYESGDIDNVKSIASVLSESVRKHHSDLLEKKHCIIPQRMVSLYFFITFLDDIDNDNGRKAIDDVYSLIKDIIE